MIPSFYDPRAVGTVYVERAAQIAEAAERARRERRRGPATDDTRRICAFGIDPQVAFCTPGASLFVPGAVEDTERVLAFLYANLERITELVFSLDTHHLFQIFHPAWWTTAEGTPVPPLTSIRLADVDAGRYRATREPEASREYLARLEESGTYVHTVWPYHALLGGVSHALVPALMEAAMFHGLVRETEPRFETKGTHPLTENYSVLAPEVRDLGGRAVGAFNQPLLDALLAFDRVYVFGQAKSHCVLSTLRDLRDHVADRRLLDKIWILEDAMSPVPAPPLDPLPPELDFPALAERAFAELREAGMHVVTTRDPIA